MAIFVAAPLHKPINWHIFHDVPVIGIFRANGDKAMLTFVISNNFDLTVVAIYFTASGIATAHKIKGWLRFFGIGLTNLWQRHTRKVWIDHGRNVPCGHDCLADSLWVFHSPSSLLNLRSDGLTSGSTASACSGCITRSRASCNIATRSRLWRSKSRFWSSTIRS